MKHLSIFLISLFTALSVFANNTIITGVVTIIVNGNKNLQIAIDGRDYNLTSSDLNGNQTTITYNNLEDGPHSIQVTRTDRNKNKSDRIQTTFYLRYGYDMLIKVNGNGSLELIETKKIEIIDNGVRMSDANFNLLLKNVRNQRSTSQRSTVITNDFVKKNNYFTTNQVFKLLQYVNSESSRIELAKLSYPIITDQSNFYQLYDLVKSEAGLNDLEVFVNNYNKDGNINVAMSEASFNSLFLEIKNQWSVSTQINSLTSTFNNINNYFTTSQAKQLIQIVVAESDRLQLSKLSYRSIIDPSNFNQLYTLLNSQYSRNELTVYVNNYNVSSGTNIAMSDVNFNTLYQDIKNQWNANTQMTLITNAFNNTYNYFNSNQASQLIQLTSVESNRLQLAKLSYRSIIDPNNFNQVYSLLNSQASQNELAVYVNNYNTANDNNNSMSDANFNILYQEIKNHWNVSSQMTFLSNAFNNIDNHFSSYQASQLIQLVSNESNRLQIAKLSYHTITDKSNFSQVVNLIGSQAGKTELTAFVNNNYKTESSPHVAMSETNFTTLIQSIERQILPFEQMNTLIEVFSSTSNFFTTAQVNKLIPLVSYESNRLQLAKLSYRSITDRGNFNQLNNLLSEQSSKNELEAYVKAYKD